MQIQIFRENPIVKLFNLEPLAPQYANKFIETVELGETGYIQEKNGVITVVYSHKKAENKHKMVSDYIEGLETSIFSTQLRLTSLNTDLQQHTDKTKIKETKALIEETERNLNLFEARLQAYKDTLSTLNVVK